MNTVDRLVYAPHIYGPSVYEHGYMREPDFPNNLPAVSARTHTRHTTQGWLFFYIR